jgi:ribose transport system permease protein
MKNTNRQRIAEMARRTAGTLMLPVLMFVIMLVATRATGKTYWGTWFMWKAVLVDVALSFTCALGIGIQFKNGRFDFSGGSVMLLSAILAGNIAKGYGNSPVVFFLLCLGFCVVLNLAVATLYVYGRMPIIIATIGAALLFESLTCIVYKGGGVSLVANTSLKAFSAFPLAMLPMGLALAVYAFYSHLTLAGKQSALLAFNQQSAVNIGINEPRNIFTTYIYGGLIFGFATSIYASSGLLKGAFVSLSTVASLFTNILPVFIGLILGAFCVDAIGIFMGSLTLCLMAFGFEALFSAEIGSALTIIMTAIFLLLLNVIAGQGRLLANMFRRGLRARQPDS